MTRNNELITAEKGSVVESSIVNIKCVPQRSIGYEAEMDHIYADKIMATQNSSEPVTYANMRTYTNSTLPNNRESSQGSIEERNEDD